MPAGFSRLLWMALQAAVVVLVMVMLHHGAVERGEPERPGLTFLLGCLVAIIVTTLLTKVWDVSRMAVVRWREISPAKVATASAYCAAAPFVVMLGRHLQGQGSPGLAVLLYGAMFTIVPLWLWIDRSERRRIAAARVGSLQPTAPGVVLHGRVR